MNGDELKHNERMYRMTWLLYVPSKSMNMSTSVSLTKNRLARRGSGKNAGLHSVHPSCSVNSR